MCHLNANWLASGVACVRWAMGVWHTGRFQVTNGFARLHALVAHDIMLSAFNRCIQKGILHYLCTFSFECAVNFICFFSDTCFLWLVIERLQHAIFKWKSRKMFPPFALVISSWTYVDCFNHSLIIKQNGLSAQTPFFKHVTLSHDVHCPNPVTLIFVAPLSMQWASFEMPRATNPNIEDKKEEMMHVISCSNGMLIQRKTFQLNGCHSLCATSNFCSCHFNAMMTHQQDAWNSLWACLFAKLIHSLIGANGIQKFANKV